MFKIDFIIQTIHRMVMNNLFGKFIEVENY